MEPQEYDIYPDWLPQDTFADRINRLRKERSITQHELAQKTGIHNSVMSLLCLGRRGPTIGHLVRLSKFFGITVSELLDHVDLSEYWHE